MKIGDTIAVSIGGHTVTNAKVTELGDGQATLVIPATKVVMGVRTELDPTIGPEGSGNQHVVLGQEVSVTTTDESGNETVVEGTPVAAPVEQPAPVVVEEPVAVAPVAGEKSE